MSAQVTTHQNGIVEALLDGAIDDAALYPPARQPLLEALTGYGHHAAGPYAQLVGTFICPIAELEAAAALSAVWPPDGLPLTLIATRSLSVASFMPKLLSDVTALAAFLPRYPRAACRALEIALPGGATHEPGAGRTFGPLIDAALTVVPAQIPVRFELPPDVDASELADALSALAPHARARLKVRCGGETPAAIPSVAVLAAQIAGASQHGVGLKFTAGLHHALTDGQRHGFLNVLVASALAYQYGLTADALGRILRESDARAFSLGPDGLTLGRWTLSVIELVHIRLRYGLTFGSCSFDEPLADLLALGWLPA
jgi:hypothetical protein